MHIRIPHQGKIEYCANIKSETDIFQVWRGAKTACVRSSTTLEPDGEATGCNSV
jgi:hypothetical protein